jgi:hypothetical protein
VELVPITNSLKELPIGSPAAKLMKEVLEEFQVNIKCPITNEGKMINIKKLQVLKLTEDIVSVEQLLLLCWA